ncbi:MAG: MBL fold metallo-hydrolase [Firmicutes bacterium]|nr:MBL fold metallo-hydrolase [Bacillota bacterium]
MAKRKKNSKFIRHLIIVLLIFGYYYIKDNQESYSKQDNTQIEKKEPIQQVTTDLSIHYIDVGQADSILITNNNHSMLIDAGNNEDGPLLVKYIKEELNISKLDYVVGTHPHEDHIGGLDDIINNIEVQEVYLPEAMTTTKTFEDVLDSIANNNLEITVPTIGETFALGEANLEVIYTGTGEKDLNEASIILKMTFGKHKYLFTGDTTEEVEKTILDKDINIDILKVAHHGSKYSSCEQFLTLATPEYAIISAGEGNSYGHPEQETLDRLKKHTNKIYVTKDLGTIVLTSDGTTIKIDNYKTNTNG